MLEILLYKLHIRYFVLEYNYVIKYYYIFENYACRKSGYIESLLI